MRRSGPCYTLLGRSSSATNRCGPSALAGAPYIRFVAAFIKETVRQRFGFVPDVVYGGGLKEENAAMLAEIEPLDGGLVALTRFAPPIAFEPEGLKRIIERYLGGRQGKKA